MAQPSYTEIVILLIVLLPVTGCYNRPPAAGSKQKSEGHSETGPHGGPLFAEPGHRYHAELVIDRTGKQARVYLLDHRAKNPVTTPARTLTLTIRNGTPLQILLDADRQGTDPMDAASCFVGKHDRLEADLDIHKVELSSEVAGKPYVFAAEGPGH